MAKTTRSRAAGVPHGLTREALLGALSAQAGVRYLASIDTASVRSAPGGLNGDEVRALGVVPFGEAAGRLNVACTAPLPSAALDAMSVLMGRPIEPFLVDDDDLVRLQAAYGAQAVPTVATWMVKDVTDGAEAICCRSICPRCSGSRARTLRR
jgi:hypothetical protein